MSWHQAQPWPNFINFVTGSDGEKVAEEWIYPALAGQTHFLYKPLF
jgi:hypothetical protein